MAASQISLGSETYREQQCIKDYTRNAGFNYVPALGQLYGTLYSSPYDCLEAQIAKARDIYFKVNAKNSEVTSDQLFLSCENIKSDLEFYRGRIAEIKKDPHARTMINHHGRGIEQITLGLSDEEYLSEYRIIKGIGRTTKLFERMVNDLQAYEEALEQKTDRFTNPISQVQCDMKRYEGWEYVPSNGQALGSLCPSVYDALAAQLSKAKAISHSKKAFFSSNDPLSCNGLSRENIEGDIEWIRRRILSIRTPRDPAVCVPELKDLEAKTLGLSEKESTIPAEIRQRNLDSLEKMVNELESYVPRR